MRAGSLSQRRFIYMNLLYVMKNSGRVCVVVVLLLCCGVVV